MHQIERIQYNPPVISEDDGHKTVLTEVVLLIKKPTYQMGRQGEVIKRDTLNRVSAYVDMKQLSELADGMCDHLAKLEAKYAGKDGL